MWAPQRILKHGPALRGWLHKIGGGEFCREVVTVDLPGVRAAEAVPLLRDLSALKKVGLDYYGPKFVIKNIDGSEPDTKCMRVQQYWPADADLRRQLPG